METESINRNQPVPVREAVKEYLASVRHLAERTLEEYTHELRDFAAWCTSQNIMLHEVNNKTVYQFLDHVNVTHKPNKIIVKRLSNVTLAGYVRVIKTFLNWCMDAEQYENHIRFMTWRRIKKPPVEQDVIEVFTIDDIDALFEACDKEVSKQLRVRGKAILAILLDTGIRASELVTLSLSNVHLDAQDSYIKILGKGSKWGEIGLGQQARYYLQSYIDTYRMPAILQQLKENEHLPPREKRRFIEQLQRDTPVFINRYGHPLKSNGLNQIITRLGDWAGIQGVRCSVHTFRHCFAVNFIRQGGSFYTLSKLLRHSSLDVTEMYLRSLKQAEARKSARSVLDNL